MTINRPELHDPSQHPLDHPKLGDKKRNIFHIIRDTVGQSCCSILMSPLVTSVERFALEASEDPKVLAIKMTLYRTSADSKIIES